MAVDRLPRSREQWHRSTVCRLRRDHHQRRDRVRGSRPGGDRSRTRRVLSGVERREPTLRLNLMALSARMLALIQKIEAADAAHFASLRELAKKQADARAEKNRANLRVARAALARAAKKKRNTPK